MDGAAMNRAVERGAADPGYCLECGRIVPMGDVLCTPCDREAAALEADHRRDPVFAGFVAAILEGGPYRLPSYEPHPSLF